MKTYTPRGSVAAMIRWLIDQGEGAEVTSTELGAATGVEAKQVGGHLMGAMDLGAVRKTMRDGRNMWSIADRSVIVFEDRPPPSPAPAPQTEPDPEPVPEPEESEPADFDAALWMNGCMTIMGGERLPDGSVYLQADEVARVRALLNGVAR